MEFRQQPNFWIILIVAFLGPAFGQCPEGFNSNQEGGLCYRVFLEKKNWTDAREVCRLYRADLAKEDDVNATSILETITSEVPIYYWIGLNDLVTENSFYWLDGTKLITHKWDPAHSQPNGATKQSCVVGKPDNHLWEDKKCSDTNSFVCESQQGPFNDWLTNVAVQMSPEEAQKPHHILLRLETTSAEECALRCSHNIACDIFTYSPPKNIDKNCFLSFFGPVTSPFPNREFIAYYISKK